MAIDLFATKIFKPHRLHGVDRSWPETNCYIDLWIEVLASFGKIPEACLGFTVAQDFGFDQFDFPKPPLSDLELLYGLKIRELSLYKSLEHHVALHVGQGRIALVEVDAFYLPDTFATTYHERHSKTTIAINHIDVNAHICSYFHNATYGKVVDQDYTSVFKLAPASSRSPDIMFPYVEIVEYSVACRPYDRTRDVATSLLLKHLAQRPDQNPFTAWRRVFDQHLDTLLSTPGLFHDYAFHFPRMAGSNFELLSSHIEWLAQEQLEHVIEGCQNIAKTTKILQYRLARSIARRKVDLADDCFDLLEDNYSRLNEALSQYFL